MNEKKISGQRIKQLRKEMKLTQDQLADLLGVQKSTISKYERGETVNLKRDTIEKLCDIFKVSSSYLMGMEDRFTVISSDRITEEAQELFLLIPLMSAEKQKALLSIVKAMYESGI